MERILLIEDDQALGRGTALALAGEGREIRVAATLAQGWAALGEGEYALVLLDLNLPDGNGLDFLTALRRTSGVPVLILTANDLESDQVAGLELGADDYVTKPFRLRELLSRIKSVLRRSGRGGGETSLTFGALTICPQRAQVRFAGRELALTALEYRLLLTFAAHPGQVLTRGQLLEGIWDVAGNFVNDNTLTVYIKRLREKLAAAGDEGRISTVRGLGYRMEGE